MAFSTVRRRRWVKGFLWVTGGFLLFKFLSSNNSGELPSRLSESGSASSLGLGTGDAPVVLESGGTWLMTMVQTVLGWIGSLLTVSLVFAVIAIAVMLLTDWSGKRT